MNKNFLLMTLAFVFSFFKGESQMLNDYGTIASGNYTDISIWRQWDGLGWNTMPIAYPNGSTQNIFIRSGHVVIVAPPGPYNSGNITVESGGKLFTNNTTTNIYITVWGTNITCNGEIGNGIIYDGICFNIEGPNCTINGSGVFTACRIRKSSIINTVTNLTIATNVTLRWDQGSNTQFYNNINSGSANFNLNINSNCVLNCEGSLGNPGNLSIDGLGGASAASAGGQVTVNGTLIVPGIIYAATNNTSTTNQVAFVVANGGTIKVGQINSPASSTAQCRFIVQNGGKLELTGVGFPIGTLNWAFSSTSNNYYDFNAGSTVEYSANAPQTVLTREHFRTFCNQNPIPINCSSIEDNQYWNLVVSGSGLKTIRTSVLPLTIRRDLTILGNAILNQDANDVDIYIGGNWTNYNQSGFLESTDTTKQVRFFGSFLSISNITCPGGEEFTRLVIAKSVAAINSKVVMQSPVTVKNQLLLGSAGTTITYGILELNRKSLTILNSSPLGIRTLGPSGYFRFIISEDTINRNTSIVNWKIDTATGTYIIPFGLSTSKDTIPFYLVKTTNNDIGTLSVSTYGTPPSNLPYPSNPISVTNLFGTNNPMPDNRDYTIDRFWYIGSTNQLYCDTLILTYNNRANTISELPIADPNIQNMKAQYWNGTFNSWQFPFQFGSNSIAPYPGNSVTIPNFNFQNTFWTLSSLNSPLPVELMEFNAEKNKNKIKLHWTTIRELDNDYFIVEKSYDAQEFEIVGIVDGKGTTNSIQKYELFDFDDSSMVIYYKLTQVDFNGNKKSFPIIAVATYGIYKKPTSFYNFLGQQVNGNSNTFKFAIFKE